MHSTCPGSGSHFLFPVHTDEFGPVRINPDGQVYVMNCPSIGGLAGPVTTIAFPYNSCIGRESQVTAILLHVYANNLYVSHAHDMYACVYVQCHNYYYNNTCFATT